MESPPPSSQTFERIRPRRWRIVAVLLGLVVAGVAAVVVISVRVASAARDREARAWSTLQACLLGPEAPAAGASPGARLRRIQLTAVGIPYREKGQDAWPGWCSSRAHALNEALRDAGHDQSGDGKALAVFAERLGKDLHDHPYPEEGGAAAFDLVWSAAKALNLPAAAADEVPPVPAPASPLTVDDLKTVPPLSPTVFPLDLLHDERVPSEALRLAVVGPKAPRAPMICTATASSDAMTCATLPSALESVQVRLLGATDDGAAPLVFAAPSGESGIYRAGDGSLLDQGVGYGGFARADGTAGDAVWDKARAQFRLRRARSGQPPRDTLFKLDDVDSDAQVALVGDALVWAANGAINVRHVLEGDAAMGAPAVVGAVPEGGLYDRDPIRGCRTSKAFALLVRGRDTDTVTIDTGDAWSTPATFEAVRGRAEALACRGTEVVFTAIYARNEAGWVEGHVRQAKCSPGTCTRQVTELAKVFPDAKETMPVRIAATDLDGKMLLVWQAGRVGGLRLRLGPQDKIADPGDAVVFDDLVHDGERSHESALLGWDVFVRGTYATLVLATTAGVHVLRIDATGKVTPLPVAWAKAG